jgi:hypothetical protein
MIELVIAALIQISTITSDGTVTSTSTESTAPTTTVSTSAVDGGTGTWDDND